VLWWTAAALSAATAGFKTASERPHPTFRSFLAAGSWWEPGEQVGPSFKKKHKDTVEIDVARSFLPSTTLSELSVPALRVVLCCLVFVCLTPAAGSSRFDLLGAKSRLAWAAAKDSSFHTLLHLATSNLVLCDLVQASFPLGPPK
jgi:hypothetical protein